MTTADTTNPLPSINEPVVDRYRRWSPLWYRWIKPLLETVKNAAGAVQEVVDQINGKWSLSVNQDNRVVGAITLDGSTDTSEFAVLADKFIIVHPSDNADEMQAFIAGVVNGVSTIGINGDLIVDGTILARSLFVDFLSAVSADLGDVTAGTMTFTGPNGVLVIDSAGPSITMTTV